MATDAVARTMAADALTLAEKAVASAGDGLTEYEKMLFEAPKIAFMQDIQTGNYTAYDLVIPETVTALGISAFGIAPPQIGAAIGILLNSVTIPKTIAAIPDYCFQYQCLRSVQFSEGLVSIGVSAFINCSGILTFSLPSTLKSIGGGAFYACSGISELTIPEGVTTIESGAFNSCTSLKTVNLPSTLITREFGENEQGIFTDCTALETVNINMPEGSIDVSNFFGLTPPTVNWLG